MGRHRSSPEARGPRPVWTRSSRGMTLISAKARNQRQTPEPLQTRGETRINDKPPRPRGHWIPLLEKTRQRQQVGLLPGPGDRGAAPGWRLWESRRQRSASRMTGNTHERLAGVRLATPSFSFPGTNRSFCGTSSFPVSFSLFEKRVWF